MVELRKSLKPVDGKGVKREAWCVRGRGERVRERGRESRPDTRQDGADGHVVKNVVCFGRGIKSDVGHAVRTVAAHTRVSLRTCVKCKQAQSSPVANSLAVFKTDNFKSFQAFETDALRGCIHSRSRLESVQLLWGSQAPGPARAPFGKRRSPAWEGSSRFFFFPLERECDRERRDKRP